VPSWRRRPGPFVAGPAGEPTWPVELDVVAGKLPARVYLQDIELQSGPVACWSYVSHGLALLEQPPIDNGERIHEDGLVMELTVDSGQEVRSSALIDGSHDDCRHG
jgi:hypothetical protein